MYLSLIWLIVGLIQIFFIPDQWWLGLGWNLLSVIYLGFALLKKREGYVSISDTEIKKNGWFGKRIQINMIEKINYFAGDYTVESSDKTIRINKDYIDEESLEKLKAQLDDLKVEIM